MYRPMMLLAAFGAVCGCFAYAQPQGPAAPPLTPQGWTLQQQRDWYYKTQGSRLLPLAWFQALEQASNTEPFLTPGFVQSFGLLPDAGGVEGLPVGFAVDQSDDRELSFSKLRWFSGQRPTEKWAGMTCSACHTAELNVDGNRVRVDGGPSLFDFQSFIEALDAALTATLNDRGKFDRFAAKVLAGRNDAPNRGMLKAELAKLIAWEKRVDQFNETPLRYGHGRVDAFGHIFNKIALFAGAPQPIPNPSDAPVSYPFLWDIYRHDRLQWNGIVESKRISLPGPGKYIDFGALGRNTGEVLGVFGDVTVRRANPLPPFGGYPSSINIRNLDELETQLRSLRPPKWPGTLDPVLVAQGQTVFRQQNCQSCHQSHSGTAPYTVVMLPLRPGKPENTDPWMACNAISYMSPTIKLQGTPKAYIGLTNRYGPQAPLAEMLETTVKGALVGQKRQIIEQAGRIILGDGRTAKPVREEAPDIRDARLKKCFEANSKFMAYKARPLDGIWATAPYLHNGSVPTLEALLDPAKRPSQFRVGTRVYDTRAVGYRTDAGAPGNVFTFIGRDNQNNPIPGNGNQGHDYGTSALSPEQRAALIAYLKSL